jgi:hypothetical protein
MHMTHILDSPGAAGATQAFSIAVQRCLIHLDSNKCPKTPAADFCQAHSV